MTKTPDQALQRMGLPVAELRYATTSLLIDVRENPIGNESKCVLGARGTTRSVSERLRFQSGLMGMGKTMRCWRAKSGAWGSRPLSLRFRRSKAANGFGCRGFAVSTANRADSFVLANGSGLEVDVHAVVFG